MVATSLSSYTLGVDLENHHVGGDQQHRDRQRGRQCRPGSLGRSGVTGYQANGHPLIELAAPVGPIDNVGMFV